MRLTVTLETSLVPVGCTGVVVDLELNPVDVGGAAEHTNPVIRLRKLPIGILVKLDDSSLYLLPPTPCVAHAATSRPDNTLKHTRLFGGRGTGGASVRMSPTNSPTSAPTAASSGTRLPTCVEINQ